MDSSDIVRLLKLKSGQLLRSLFKKCKAVFNHTDSFI